jgi:hypothetical protein
MKTKNLQMLFLVLGFTFAIFAAILSFEKEQIKTYGSTSSVSADGSAAGFAILAGLCFVAVSITTLRNDK